MKKTDQSTSTRPIVKPPSRPSSRNQVLPPLTPEEQSKRAQPQTIKDLTGFSTDQLLKKGQKAGTVRLKKLDHQPKPRNSADTSKENELPSTSSASTSASKRKPLPKTNKNLWTSSSTDQFEAGSEHSSFSVEPEENQAGINITKALKSQKESGELEKFLKECGLPQYVENFREHGFDDLDTILEIQVKHLVDMRIPAGHQVKISRRIEQIREPQNNSITNCLSDRGGSSNLAQINMSQINSSREGYSGRIEVTEPDKDEAIGEDKGGRSLLDGAFNEEESHASFLEALNEWRNRKPVQQVKAEPVKAEPPKRILRKVKSKEQKSVRFADSKKEEEEEGEDVDYICFKGTGAGKKPFFFSGGESWNVVEMPTLVESGTDARRPAQPKVSCWHCFQLTTEKESKKVGERVFCKDDCVKAFREQNSIGCSKRGCKKRFMKEEGTLREGNWFCGDNCAPVGDRRAERNRGAANRGVSQGEDYSEGEEMEAFELSVDFGNKKVMSMAQLEEKYQRNMVESG